ncbi:MAG: ethanolamine ammonia-lyase light chain EutC, partial [Gimesia sp.]|nr:ethanolamine ammonia-lyase light chain EutC [Gimesia sp.]
HGEKQSDLEPSLKIEIDQIYQDAKKSIWAQLTPDFISNVPDSILIETQSTDRLEYILHPSTGEQLSKSSIKTIQELRKRYDSNFDVQIVISDGLNALSIMDEGQLEPFLKALRQQLQAAGFRTGEQNLIVQSGRVRAGYRIGELLFGGLPHNRSLLHIIGERPGTGHHTFSVYMTSPPGSVWGQLDQVDHNITKVVSGIAVTALKPDKAADDTVRILKQMNFG